MLTTCLGLHSTAGGQNLNPRPTDRKSSILTTWPPSHTGGGLQSSVITMLFQTTTHVYHTRSTDSNADFAFKIIFRPTTAAKQSRLTTKHSSKTHAQCPDSYHHMSTIINTLKGNKPVYIDEIYHTILKTQKRN